MILRMVTKLLLMTELQEERQTQQQKVFTDPTKIGPVRFSTTTEGPDNLIVKKGINFFGKCVNKKCIAFNKEVSSPFGFGTFDLIKDLDANNENCPKCPSCEIPILKLETCGFIL